VIGVDNGIYLDSPTPYAGDVQHSIKKAFQRDAKLDADNIAVETTAGTAILTGSVRSFAEHDAAVGRAYPARSCLQWAMPMICLIVLGSSRTRSAEQRRDPAPG